VVSMFVAFMPSAVTNLALVLQGLLLALCFYKLHEIVERRRVRAEEELVSSFLAELDDRDCFKRKARKPRLV